MTWSPVKIVGSLPQGVGEHQGTRYPTTRFPFRRVGTRWRICRSAAVLEFSQPREPAVVSSSSGVSSHVTLAESPLAVWVTLEAYGREGYRTIVERHLELAQRLASAIDAAPELERLADVPLNIVCLRYNPGGRSEGELDRLNRRLGEAILSDGRVFAGTTVYAGKVALRPAIVNWRTGPEHIDEFVRVVRELAGQLPSR